MIRLVLFLAAVLVAAVGLGWLADRPGVVTLDWQGYVLETTVFRAVVMLGILVAASILGWAIVRNLWRSPAAIGEIVTRRRERRGLDAISSGMIAIGSGDKALAMRAAVQARKSLPNEPLTHLLRAQAAQLQGDGATARRIFEAMLASPDTEQVGLRGLYLEAQRVGENEAAAQFAERALRLSPKLDWPATALFDLQCKAKDWDGALETLTTARKHGQVDKKLADRRRAVLLTALAQEKEDSNPDEALGHALEAHAFAPDLVPAAAIAGRVLAARGQTPKAAKVLQKTWKLAPHPDLAMAYAYARSGDSASDRLQRVRQLATSAPGHVEGPIAVATIAMEQRDWEAARAALAPLAAKDLTQRVATLMARIEGEGFDNAGKVREWFARAVHAAPDPAWTADGIVADQWAPISPVSGQLDAFQWRVPVEALDKPGADMIAARMEEVVRLGAGGSAALPGIAPQRSSPPIEDVTVRTVPVTDAMATARSAKPAAAPAASVTADDRDDDEAPPSPPPADRTGAPRAPAAGSRDAPSMAARTAVSRMASEPAAYPDPSHAPDDPGPKTSDPATAKSQLERYRLVGAKS